MEHGKFVRPSMELLQQASLENVIFRPEVAPTTIPSDEAVVDARHDTQELSSGCDVILTRLHQMRLAEARGILDRTQNLNFMEVELRERTDVPLKAERMADRLTELPARYPDSAGQGSGRDSGLAHSDSNVAPERRPRSISCSTPVSPVPFCPVRTNGELF